MFVYCSLPFLSKIMCLRATKT